ncbi:MAG: PQQ-binding-like beta-propeller repeat protein [Dehalococcoidia bacterium]
MRDAAALNKRCPSCGRLLRGDSLRCGYCLTEVRDVPADAAAPLAQAGAEPAPPPRLAASAWRRFRAVPSWLLLLAAAVLIVGGWYAYQSLKPERTLALPASAARTLPSGPEVWAAPGGDAGNTRSTAARFDPSRASVAWQTDLGVTVSGEPVADSEHLYVATVDNRVLALRLRDGSPAWTFEAAVPIGESPLVDAGRVIVTTRRGDVVSLEAATGAVVWESRLETNFYNAASLSDGVVYAFGARHEVFGLSAEDGTRLWAIGTGSDWATEPALILPRSVVVATADRVKLYDRVHGSLTLEYPHGRVIGLAQAEDHLISVSANFIAGVDPSARLPWWWGARGVWFDLWVWGLAPEPPRAGLRWLHDLRPTAQGPQASIPEVFPPALGGGLAVVATDQGVVRAFDIRTGEERWRIETDAVTGPPVITPDGLLVPARDAVALHSLDDGAERARVGLTAATRRSLVVTSNGAFLVDRQGRITGVR